MSTKNHSVGAMSPDEAARVLLEEVERLKRDVAAWELAFSKQHQLAADRGAEIERLRANPLAGVSVEDVSLMFDAFLAWPGLAAWRENVTDAATRVQSALDAPREKAAPLPARQALGFKNSPCACGHPMRAHEGDTLTCLAGDCECECFTGTPAPTCERCKGTGTIFKPCPKCSTNPTCETCEGK